jgi:hypothetical protein
MNDYNGTIHQLREHLQQRKIEWWDWHQANPHVWKLFEKYTLEAINSGLTSYSHWFIVNRIRWDFEVVTKSGEFKISNNHIAFYARLFHAYHPVYSEFFNIKPFKEERMIEELSTRNVIYLNQLHQK